ncbi:MAG: hypothetical protein DMG53_07565 [Acidobacteria bacterium]|nr:MAG: hypothetical protein DMG53_07565 [Acidobacteriota bacterium]
MCLAAPVAVHAQGDYLDVYIVKVKPEKLADFQALTKKWIDANRRFNGDHWIAMETVYGDGNVFQFTSVRQDYADVDKVNEAVMNAANKTFGKEIADKMGRDFQNCLVWSRSELRRRRWDLSRKAPTDPATYAKFIGESRVLRTNAVHVRPGHVPEFEALMFQQVNAESVDHTESTLFRFSPELSNPPEEVATVAADFWRPKAAMAASASKPKAPTAKSAELKPTADKPKQ